MLIFGQTAEPGALAKLATFAAGNWAILVPTALGLAGIWVLLPKGGRARPPWAAPLCAAAMVMGGVLLIRAEAALPETILFYAFAGIAVLGGGLLLTQSNPVRAALSFALVVLSTCGLFLLQGAPFLMASTIIVYAGAIVVTFLFVIMLAQQEGFAAADQRTHEPFLGVLAGFILLTSLLSVVQRNYDTRRLDALLATTRQAAQAKSFDDIQAIVGDPDKFFKEFRATAPEVDFDVEPKLAATDPPMVERDQLHTALNDAELFWSPKKLEALKDALRRIHEHGERVRFRVGSLTPRTNLPLSPFSGTKANAHLPDLQETKERLPAQNVAALGRALFTDYLLLVELAGVLLLVASIGAVVIAGRRAEVLK